jgi:hypothetical protein
MFGCVRLRAEVKIYAQGGLEVLSKLAEAALSLTDFKLSLMVFG